MRMSDSDSAPLKRTPLHALHLARGGKMTPFAGYAMPLHYPGGILKEHLHTRESACLFDVSHMGQIEVRGDDIAATAEALESLTPADVLALPAGMQRYALLTDERGGILDDLMAQRIGGRFILVVNAANKHLDVKIVRGAFEAMPGAAQVQLLDRALLALQGPAAAAVLAECVDDSANTLDDFKFMQVRAMTVAGTDCIVSRSGYTGEDGFEVSVAAADAAALARRLLADERVKLAGLGARDSLRLEAGLCLHGHDITAATTPAEAGLNWAVAKARRPGGARAGNYPGAEVIAAQLQGGAHRKRVGLLPAGRAPVRAGAELFADSTEANTGVVTSGAFSPTLRRPVAMGMVAREHAAAGAKLYTVARGKRFDITVAPLPFVAHRYHR